MKYIKGTFETESSSEVEYILLKTEEDKIVLITEEFGFIDICKFKNIQDFVVKFCRYKDKSEYLEDYIDELIEEINSLKEQVKEQDILLDSLEE